MTAIDSYSISAKYYDDAYAVKKDLLDLGYYLDLVKRVGGPVLEIGCGTGRVLLAVARSGITIHGVDNSSNMLSVLRKNLSAEPRVVQERVSIFEGDMRNFHLPQKYPLVIMPFRPLQHMYTVPDQVAALQTAASHLRQSGVFAFDVFFPKFDKIDGGIGEEMFELEWPVKSETALRMKRYFRKEAVDKINQNFSATFIFRTYRGNDLIKEETEPLKMSYYTYPQLQGLFLLAGLEPMEQYGSFDRGPLDNNAKEMIFVLRKKP